MAHLLTFFQTRSTDISTCIHINILHWPRISVWGPDCFQSAPRMAVGAMGARHVCPQRDYTVLAVSSDILLRFAGAFALCTILVLCETRPAVILARIAKNIRKTTGDTRYRSTSEIDKPSMLSLIKTTCKRPLCAQDRLFLDLLTVQFQIYC